jgi:hypothetical protein
MKFSVHPSILLNSGECSPLGVNVGANISPRGQISPLEARGEVHNGPLKYVIKDFSYILRIVVPELEVLRDFSELKTLQRVEHFTRTNRSEITVARFFLFPNLPKRGKSYQKTTNINYTVKYSKWS